MVLSWSNIAKLDSLAMLIHFGHFPRHDGAVHVVPGFCRGIGLAGDNHSPGQFQTAVIHHIGGGPDRLDRTGLAFRLGLAATVLVGVAAGIWAEHFFKRRR